MLGSSRFVLGNPTILAVPEPPGTRRRTAKETVVEMGWMETFELLGLHLLVALLLSLVALDQVVQYTLHALRPPQAAEPKRLPPIGAQRHA